MGTETYETSPRRPVVSDPHHVPTVFVDWIVGGGVIEGVLHVTLGTVDYSSRPRTGEAPQVTVATKMRMSRDFAANLHAMLGEMLSARPPRADG